MTDAPSIALALAFALAGGWGASHAGMRLLLPALRDSRMKAENYRKTEVFVGLGVVWVFWATALSLAVALQRLSGIEIAIAPFGGQDAHPAMIAVAVVVGAFLFGLIDDVFGSSSAKGFKGHFRTLAKGRLTTGALKALGIGFVSLLAGFAIADLRGFAGIEYFGVALLSTIVIALSANLLNLLDLRPGRALKGYALMSCLGVLAIALPVFGGIAATLASAASALLWLLGPAVAVARYDLAEEGMLGDAGANAAGALVGLMLALGSSLPTLGVAAILLVAANALSEKVSYTRLIEANTILSRVDSWGRK
ncbi:MAG: hypothetical protein M1617_03285 [Actinobacteria bacterium]|nr:hypothetical protein [Actinomycetota bacterium]